MNVNYKALAITIGIVVLIVGFIYLLASLPIIAATYIFGICLVVLAALALYLIYDIVKAEISE